MSYARKLLQIFSVTIALAAYGSPASAVPVAWAFNPDVAFGNDAAIFQVPGFPAFIYDADTDEYSLIIFNSLGNDVSGDAFENDNSYLALFPNLPSNATQLFVISGSPPAPGADLSGRTLFFFQFEEALSNAGGTVDLSIGALGDPGASAEGLCGSDPACLLNTPANGVRVLTAGSLTGTPLVSPPQTNVPEPSALALFFVGLGGIAVVARRRRKGA